jgi:hypothetical protein
VSMWVGFLAFFLMRRRARSWFERSWNIVELRLGGLHGWEDLKLNHAVQSSERWCCLVLEAGRMEKYLII